MYLTGELITDRKDKDMRKSEERHITGKTPKLTVTKNIIKYIFVFIISLIFTQALRSPASAIFFIFILLLPPIMLLYLVTANIFIKAKTNTQEVTIIKKTPYKFSFALCNEFIIPYPFIDAYVRLPQINNVRTNIRKVYLTLLPRNTYLFSNTVQFRFRGTYEMGIDYIYVYDLLRIFRMKIKIDRSINIYAIPRKLILNKEGQGAISDSETTTKKALTSFEKVDISDTRQYRTGDSLKSIHWKLSSKADDFIVRDYETGSSKETYIYIDLSSPYPYSPNDDEINNNSEEERIKKLSEYNKANEPNDDSFYEDMNEYCADGVVDLAIGAVLRELNNGNKCSLFWFDNRSKSGVCAYSLANIEDFLVIYNFFSTAPLVQKEKNLPALCKSIKASESTKQIYITSAIGKESIVGICNCATVNDSVNVETKDVIIYNPIERYKYKKERKKYIQSCKKELAEHGISLIEGSLFSSDYSV